jgi:hypothetical protein
MAATETSKDALQQQLERERQELAQSLQALRSIDPAAMLRDRLPLLLAGAFAVAFLLGGGIGATMRLLARRSREGTSQARLGRFALINRN